MNPYTVLLLEKPSESQQALLLEQLQSKFRLNETQAQSLAQRSSGHILKPTTQQKAQQIAQLYLSLGLKVEVVEVAPTLVGTVAVPPPAPSRVVVRSSVAASPTLPTPSAPQPLVPPAIPESGSEPIRKRIQVSAFNPAGEPSGLQSSSAYVGKTDSQAGTSTQPSSIHASTHVSTHSVATSTNPLSSRNVVSGTSAIDPMTAPSSDREFDGVRSTVVDEPVGSRRTSLASRLLLTTLLPIMILVLSVVVYLSISLPSTFDTLRRQSANQLAASISNSIDLKDLSKADLQLRGLTSLPDIAFVRVTSSTVNLFRSKFPDADKQFSADFNTFIAGEPKATQFTWKNNLSGTLKTAMDQMKTNSSDSKRLAEMQTELDQAQLQAGQSTTFDLEQVGAYKWLGTIKIGPLVAPEGQLPPAFIVSVGVINDSNRSLVWKQILAIVAVALLGLALAAYFALRTSRRITKPILELAEAADQISLGKMEYEIKVGRNDEIGDLAQALERMRVSLTSALERLRSRRR